MERYYRLVFNWLWQNIVYDYNIENVLPKDFIFPCGWNSLNFTIVKTIQLSQNKAMEVPHVSTNEVRIATRQSENAILALLVNLVSISSPIKPF